MKGKAAIDVVCNPLGKSGGALIQQFMILTFGSLANSTPYLGGILLFIVLGWIAAARSLDSQFTALAKEELVTETKRPSDADDSAFAKSEENGGNGSVMGETGFSALKEPAAEGSDSSEETKLPRS